MINTSDSEQGYRIRIWGRTARSIEVRKVNYGNADRFDEIPRFRSEREVLRCIRYRIRGPSFGYAPEQVDSGVDGDSS